VEPRGRIGALLARNSAKNSAKFLDEMSIRLLAEDSSPQPASGNLVVDRTVVERSVRYAPLKDIQTERGAL
jgi:hypothetical protein